MNKFLIICTLFFTFNSFSQNLNCEDFKEGEFLIPADRYNPTSFKVIRSNNQQIEIKENGEELLIDIKYTDKCNYILTSNPNSDLHDEIAQIINDKGGVKVEMIEIIGDKLFYNSYIKLDDKNFSIPGKLIKLK
ncbi:MAG: hypothetical protein QNK89_01870 [Lacinutrix sp.]|uniref:hypothetical protein n=1 Tax=Lacinutrix sp. TaxID=1937692 RepID=UPI0030A126CE